MRKYYMNIELKTIGFEMCQIILRTPAIAPISQSKKSSPIFLKGYSIEKLPLEYFGYAKVSRNQLTVQLYGMVRIFFASLMLLLVFPRHGRAAEDNIDICKTRFSTEDMKYVFDQNTNMLQRRLYDSVLQLDLNQVRNTISKGANPNFRGLHYEWLIDDAVQTWNIDILNPLLEAGADPNRSDCLKRPALAYLEIPGDHGFPSDDTLLVKIAERLSQYGAGLKSTQPERWLAQVLMLSAGHGHVNLMNWLLDHRADINGEFDGTTPLMSAIRSNQLDATEILLARGANPNAGSKLLPTPLLIAIDVGNPELVRILLEHGANANQSRAVGQPLSEAIGRRQLAARSVAGNQRYDTIVKLLIDSGAK